MVERAEISRAAATLMAVEGFERSRAWKQRLREFVKVAEDWSDLPPDLRKLVRKYAR